MPPNMVYIQNQIPPLRNFAEGGGLDSVAVIQNREAQPLHVSWGPGRGVGRNRSGAMRFQIVNPDIRTAHFPATPVHCTK